MAEISIEQLPKRLRDLFEKARQAVSTGNLDYAIDMLCGLLEQEPRLLDARRMLRLTQVKRFLSKGSASAMRHTMSSLSGMGKMMKASGGVKKNPLEALALAERLMSTDPLNPSFYNIVVRAAEAADLPEVAVHALETAREESPDDIPLLRRMAEMYKKIGDTTKARECYERVQKLKPNDPMALKDLKDAQATDTMNKGRWTDGRDFRSKISNVEEARKLEQASRAMKTSSDLDEIIGDYRARVAKEPDNINVRRQLAEALAKNNQYADALAILDEAETRTGGGDPQVDRLRTSIRTRQFDSEIAAREEKGDSAGAAALEKDKETFIYTDSEERVKRYPNDLQFKYEYGVQLFNRDLFNEAIQQFQASGRNPQRRIRSLWYLARCFEKKGQFDIASEQLEKAISELSVMDDTKKDVLYELGVVKEKMGQKEKAIEAFKEIYATDIGYRDVAQRIESFYKKS